MLYASCNPALYIILYAAISSRARVKLQSIRPNNKKPCALTFSSAKSSAATSVTTSSSTNEPNERERYGDHEERRGRLQGGRSV